MSSAMSRLAKTWSSTWVLKSRSCGFNSTSAPSTILRRHFAVKPVIIRKRGDAKQQNSSASSHQNIDLGPNDYNFNDADLSKYIDTGAPQSAKPTSPYSTAKFDDYTDEIDKILKQSGIDLDSLEFNTGPSTPQEYEMDDADDDYDSASDREYDGFDKFTKPQFDFPQDSFLGVVAMMLEATPNGITMFPNHMRKKLLEKVASNVKNAVKRYPQLTEQALFNIVQHTFITDGPDLAYTHDQAINILFPFAPQKGDIVELPGTPGKCVVSSREYIDNRDNTDLPLDERTRMMVLHYECLDPSLRGRTMRAVHQFDLDVYRLTMAGDAEGMEDLMHERGLIDKHSGRILIDQFEARALEEGYSQSTPKLQGPGAGMARLAALANMPNRHGLDGAQHHIAGGRVRSGAVSTGKNEVALRRNAFGEMVPVDQVEDEEEAVQRGLKVKEYQRPHVITGEAAQRLHKQLLYEQQSGAPAGAGAQLDATQMKPSAAQLRAAESKRAQMQQEQQQQQQQHAAPVASHRPLSASAESLSGSTHTQAPIHGHSVTLGDLRRQAAADEQGAVSEMTSAAQASAYAQRRANIEAAAAAKRAEVAQRGREPVMTEEEMRQRREAALREAMEQDLKQDEEFRGLSAEERQMRLLKALEEREKALQEKDRARMEQLDAEGKVNYERLAPDVKQRYRSIIMSSGAGAGKPDPMFIKEGEDLLHVYPDANVGLMDAISGQWDAMMELRKQEGEDLPGNPAELRYRLMATIASAGKHAFSLDYMQEVFQRFTQMRDTPKKPEPWESPLSGPQARVSSDSEHKSVFAGSIKSGTEGPRDEQNITIPHPTKKKAKTEALIAEAEAVFGMKAVPLEDAPNIDPAFREEVRAYYELREKRKALKKGGRK